ncbi:uncharacterized protein LOC136090468 [Hydra vulgaris]|uniref:Uncharacterized protein LOC136090468 n=1 Tax=Hydra vulgaris TaxID=6087 RepID=A0ABM4DFM8_HYDVU
MSKTKAGKQKLEEDKKLPVFADPIMDVTFKMLFGSEQNKDLLISLINSLLDFQNSMEIEDLELNNNELPISVVSDEKGGTSIASAIDILCTNKGKQKIAIEVQGQKTAYFLSREKEYMSKLISGQVKDGEGKLYYKKVLDTYIIVICKENVFTGNTALTNQKLFELDVKPTILQTGEVYPGNMMHWKFYELLKFKQSSIYENICKESPLKYQWLEFLIDCSKHQVEPDRNTTIKKGYEIMKVAKWDSDTQALYWKQKMNAQEAEEIVDETFEKGMEKGKLKGEIKGEISKVKDFLDFGASHEQNISKLKFLTQDKVKDKIETNLAYIQEHLADSDSDICDELGLVGDLLEN